MGKINVEIPPKAESKAVSGLALIEFAIHKESFRLVDVWFGVIIFVTVYTPSERCIKILERKQVVHKPNICHHCAS